MKKNTQHALYTLLLGLVINGLITSTALAGSTEKISNPIGNNPATSKNLFPAMSADGRYVAYYSNSSELVSGDTNNNYDVFVYDRDSAVTSRVSVAGDGSQALGHSLNPAISADGRYIAFSSFAANLVASDNNSMRDVFVHDRQANTTVLVSLATDGTAANNASYSPAISPDGRYVVFFSTASNLVPDDTNSANDVFIHDRQTGVTERMSVDSNGIQANGTSSYSAVSSDGRYVSFYSAASNLVPNDNNARADIFVRDRQTGTTERISVNSTGIEANNESRFPNISGDGRYVVFESSASNLVSNDNNGTSDIFMHDRTTHVTQLLSISTEGAIGNGISQRATISNNGRFVTFMSAASNLHAGDSNGQNDVFVRDTVTGTTQAISRASSGQLGNNSSSSGYKSASSENGRFVVFYSLASDLVDADNNPADDIFIHDLQASVLQPPIADAGLDQTLECSSKLTNVTLDASGSFDPDNDPLSYNWSGPFGTAIGQVVSVALPVGLHNINLSVQDAQHPAVLDALNVTVQDTNAPTLAALQNLSLEATSALGAEHNLVATATDLCGDVTISLSPALTVYPLGVTTLTVTAEDSSGNTSSNEVSITVVDSTAPGLTAPADIKAIASGPLTSVNLGQANATDHFAVTVTNDAPAAGFPEGQTQVTWTATDANGNATSATQLVTIIGNVKPVAKASLVRIPHRYEGQRRGFFRVEYSCESAAETVVDAKLNGVDVKNGQMALLVRIKKLRKQLYFKRRGLFMIASDFTLVVQCTDNAGQSDIATAKPAFKKRKPRRDHDDDDDDDDDDD